MMLSKFMSFGLFILDYFDYLLKCTVECSIVIGKAPLIGDGTVLKHVDNGCTQYNRKSHSVLCTDYWQRYHFLVKVVSQIFVNSHCGRFQDLCHTRTVLTSN